MEISETKSETPSRYDAPGKVFLMGEYAVLAGLPAWLVPIGHRFRLSVDRTRSVDSALPFPLESPAGRLFQKMVQQSAACARYSWKWEDPYQGAGGFGGSSAQFILLYRAMAHELGWDTTQISVLKSYRALHQTHAVPPSGADIATQWEGGVVRFDSVNAAKKIDIPLDPERLLLFSATGISGRKIRTHEHLHKLGPQFFESHAEPLLRMKDVLQEFEDQANRNGGTDTDSLASSLRAYTQALVNAGLEAPEAAADRLILERLPGVKAVKGTGAGLSDAVWVVLDSAVSSEQRREVLRLARSRGLTPVPLCAPESGIGEVK